MSALVAVFNPNGDDVNFNGTKVQNAAVKTVVETGTTISFSSTHYGASIEHTNASATTMNLPDTPPVGTWFILDQLGAGATTISCSGGTLRSRGNKYKTGGQYASVFGKVIANSDGASAEWLLAGDLTT